MLDLITILGPLQLGIFCDSVKLPVPTGLSGTTGDQEECNPLCGQLTVVCPTGSFCVRMSGGN